MRRGSTIALRPSFFGGARKLQNDLRGVFMEAGSAQRADAVDWFHTGLGLSRLRTLRSLGRVTTVNVAEIAATTGLSEAQVRGGVQIFADKVDYRKHDSDRVPGQGPFIGPRLDETIPTSVDTAQSIAGGLNANRLRPTAQAGTDDGPVKPSLVALGSVGDGVRFAVDGPYLPETAYFAAGAYDEFIRPHAQGPGGDEFMAQGLGAPNLRELTRIHNMAMGERTPHDAAVLAVRQLVGIAV